MKETTAPRIRNLLKISLLLCVPLLASLVVAEPQDRSNGKITEAERSYLLQELESTESLFLASIEGVTPTQWTFKPAPDVWSIQECAEHVILAEDLIFGESQRILLSPVVPRLTSATAQGDREMVVQMQDRSKKAKAPQILQPTGRFPSPESAAIEFKARRSKTISYVKTTQDPLRIHTGDAPAGGTADAYQFLLQLAAHSARHTAQLNAVKSAPGYGGNGLGWIPREVFSRVMNQHKYCHMNVSAILRS